MYPMKQEVQHEKEGLVGKDFFNVEHESMHDVFEDLYENDSGEFLVDERQDRGKEIRTVQMTFPTRKQIPVRWKAVAKARPAPVCCTID